MSCSSSVSWASRAFGFSTQLAVLRRGHSTTRTLTGTDRPGLGRLPRESNTRPTTSGPSASSASSRKGSASADACTGGSSGASGESPTAQSRNRSSSGKTTKMAAAAAAAAAASGGAAPKLKLLCLHGYMQNAEVFRSRLGSLRKALKSRVEFVFVDAPFEAQGLPGGDDPEEVQGARDGRSLSWWSYTDQGANGRPSKATSYTGWEVAQSFLLSALQEHRPDGLLGFSQGATAAALLLSHLATVERAAAAAAKTGDTNASNSHIHDSLTAGSASGSSNSDLVVLEASRRLKCAILVAGFLPRDPSVAALVQTGGPSNTVPLLFVTGTSDSLVPPERTTQLWDCFTPSSVSSFTHGGAHLVPTCSGQFKSVLLEFLDVVKGAAGPVLSLHKAQAVDQE